MNDIIYTTMKITLTMFSIQVMQSNGHECPMAIMHGDKLDMELDNMNRERIEKRFAEGRCMGLYHNSNGATYYVMAGFTCQSEVSKLDTFLLLESPNSPVFVVACYVQGKSWAHGHYFDVFEDALDDLFSQAFGKRAYGIADEYDYELMMVTLGVSQ